MEVGIKIGGRLPTVLWRAVRRVVFFVWRVRVRRRDRRDVVCFVESYKFYHQLGSVFFGSCLEKAKPTYPNTLNPLPNTLPNNIPPTLLKPNLHQTPNRIPPRHLFLKLQTALPPDRFRSRPDSFTFFAPSRRMYLQNGFESFGIG